MHVAAVPTQCKSVAAQIPPDRDQTPVAKLNMDDLVTCPIDNNHRVRQSYLPFHLVKCDRAYKVQCQETGFPPTVKPCRYDAVHWVEKNSHHDCRKMREYQLWSLGRASNKESWDNEGANSVSPAEESWDGANSVGPAEESWDDGANSVSPAEESWNDGADSVGANTEENWEEFGRLRIETSQFIIRRPPSGLTKAQRLAFRKNERHRHCLLQQEEMT